MLDIMEQSATGRVLAYDPATGSTRIVARGFSFANGIALSSDGHTLFVTETGRYRIWKIDGRASDLDVQSGVPQAACCSTTCPAIPDNLMRGRDGRLWVGLFKPRNPAADRLPNGRSCERCCCGCRGSCCRSASRTGTSSPSTRSGRVTDDLQDPSGAYPDTTGATETADRLYIHSLQARALGWLPR